MLNVIRKLDAGTIRALAAATLPLLVLIGSLFGLDEVMFEAELSVWVERIAALAAAGAVAWAAWERLFKPTPPLTETAMRLTEERLYAEGKATVAHASLKEGGFARTSVLATVTTVAALTLVACGTLFPKAVSFNDKVAAAYVGVTAVRESAIVLLDARVERIQRESDVDKRRDMLLAAQADAQAVQDHADRARAAVDVARSLRDVDLKSAENRLDSALKIVGALQEYLEKEGAL